LNDEQQQLAQPGCVTKGISERRGRKARGERKFFWPLTRSLDTVYRTGKEKKKKREKRGKVRFPSSPFENARKGKRGKKKGKKKEGKLAIHCI